MSGRLSPENNLPLQKLMSDWQSPERQLCPRPGSPGWRRTEPNSTAAGSGSAGGSPPPPPLHQQLPFLQQKISMENVQ